ncbi:Mov34/MPN/PAD-1 family protein [Paenibacillus septentrionalis]|uniref:Mov34/MPN/PAD-1 family protein n=1 Tax=Paenibacillus septentrionalis TaxID=429342 RepID=A0ABW1V183_9BACL
MQAVTTISSTCRQQLIDYALQQLPEEACGLLLAPIGSDTITVMQPIANRHHSRVYAFTFDAEQWVHYYFHASKLNLSVVGIFHSHPHEQPLPSEADMNGFFDQHMLYAIIGFNQKESPQIRFYRRSKNRFIDFPLVLT